MLTGGRLRQTQFAGATLVGAGFGGSDLTEALFADAVDATYLGPNPAINGFAQSNGAALKIISGATSGPNPPADLTRVFFLQLQVLGSTMGTRAELVDMISFLQASGLRPHIDRVLPLDKAAEGLAAMASGDLVGKIVLEV